MEIQHILRNNLKKKKKNSNNLKKQLENGEKPNQLDFFWFLSLKTNADHLKTFKLLVKNVSHSKNYMEETIF